MICRTMLPGPLGYLYARAEQDAITHLDFLPQGQGVIDSTSSVFQTLRSQLEEYFRGERHIFDVPLAIVEGTPFQRAVWQACCDIPYGSTRTYSAIAQAIGASPKSAQAVGQALSENPLPILIPCHRVVAANGRSGGYAGDIWRKEALLALESGHSLMQYNEANQLDMVRRTIVDKGTVLLYLASNDCGACEVMGDKIRRGLLYEDLSMLHVSLNRVPEAKGAFMAFIGPVVLLFKNGREVFRVAGILDTDQVIHEIQALLSENPFTS